MTIDPLTARGGAQPGAGGDRRRRGDRLQHRLPPGPPGLDRRGAARAAPADRRDDVARGRADHLGRDDGRDRAVLQPVLAGPVRPAGAGDRALHRVPRRSGTSRWPPARGGRRRCAGRRPGCTGFGVEDTEISPRELADMWPLARTDDVLSAFYVADEGRADPVGVATSLAKGARQLGVRVVEGVTATGVETRGRQVTRRAHRARAGSRPRWWSTRRACGPGSSGPWPGSAFRSRPPSTTTCSPTRCRGWTRTCRSSRTRTTTATTGPRATACWSGLFEPVGAPWSLDGVPGGFSFGKISPDWERMEPFLGPALDRIPVLSETGRADLLLRAGVVHRRRPAAARARPRAGRLLRRGRA